MISVNLLSLYIIRRDYTDLSSRRAFNLGRNEPRPLPPHPTNTPEPSL